MKDEVARLKQHKGNPKIPPSRLEKDPREPTRKKNSNAKRPGSRKRSKTKDLIIHETIPVHPRKSLPVQPVRGMMTISMWTIPAPGMRAKTVTARISAMISLPGSKGLEVKAELTS